MSLDSFWQRLAVHTREENSFVSLLLIIKPSLLFSIALSLKRQKKREEKEKRWCH